MKWQLFGKRNRPEAESQASLPAESQGTAGQGKKILIVDDDAVIIKTTSLKLKAQGYEVSSAMDASEAMTAVRQSRPDLILLDISFPPDVGIDWDGFKII